MSQTPPTDTSLARATEVKTLADILRHQAAHSPLATALWWQGRPTSYQTLNQRVEKLAARLACVGQKGDRLAVVMWNNPAFLELIYAAARAGRILVPLNARLAPAEWNYQLESTQCSMLFGEQELLTKLRDYDGSWTGLGTIAMGNEYEEWLERDEVSPTPQVNPGDIAWILFTSGSTGRPKGAQLSHGAFIAGLDSAALARPVEASDRYFYPFPLFHVAAHNVLLQHRYGASVVLARSFDAAETLESCRSLGVTTMSLAPTMIAMLLDHPEFDVQVLDQVRTIGYGASAMPESLLRKLLRDTRVGLCQSYGMTELCGSVAFLTVEDHRQADANPALLASVGKPLPTATIRIVDDAGNECATGEHGEIIVKARQCMSGYWRDTVASENALKDGWLYTGDIGRFDDKAYLYIVDRKKDMIISGGENIASREVEEVMRLHPAVRDCAIIGLADEQWGEIICAVAQLHHAVDNDILSQHCRAHLAGYKTPKRWETIDALPLNASGKVDKPLLRKMFAQKNS
jgi:acyl-CoA synthetase (AMP-forming)/AMP-acid ligase II